MTPETSKAKAIASAAFGKATKELMGLQKDNPAFWSALPSVVSEGALPTTGGVPVTVNGQIIGAIGCGGGTPDQDHECAMAAIKALERDTPVSKRACNDHGPR